MPQPLFDRVDDTPTEPPAHLAGKSSQEINEYWMNRERQIRQELATPPTDPNAPPTPPQPPRQPVTVASPSGMTQGQLMTLIAGAKLVAAQGKEHWQRYLPEVEGIMGHLTADQQCDANMWNTVYDKVVGMHVQDLVKEAREAALRPPSMESSSPASPPSAPRVLSSAEMHVVDQLRRAGATAVRKDAQGIAHQVPFDAEAYLAADERRQKGVWPLTYNNY